MEMRASRMFNCCFLRISVASRDTNGIIVSMGLHKKHGGSIGKINWEDQLGFNMIILGYLSIFHFLDLMDRKYVNNFLQIHFRKAQHGTAWLTTRNGASLKRPGRSSKHQTFDHRMTLSTFEIGQIQARPQT